MPLSTVHRAMVINDEKNTKIQGSNLQLGGMMANDSLSPLPPVTSPHPTPPREPLAHRYIKLPWGLQDTPDVYFRKKTKLFLLEQLTEIHISNMSVSVMRKGTKWMTEGEDLFIHHWRPETFIRKWNVHASYINLTHLPAHVGKKNQTTLYATQALAIFVWSWIYTWQIGLEIMSLSSCI